LLSALAVEFFFPSLTTDRVVEGKLISYSPNPSKAYPLLFFSTKCRLLFESRRTAGWEELPPFSMGIVFKCQTSFDLVNFRDLPEIEPLPSLSLQVCLRFLPCRFTYRRKEHCLVRLWRSCVANSIHVAFNIFCLPVEPFFTNLPFPLLPLKS